MFSVVKMWYQNTDQNTESFENFHVSMCAFVKKNYFVYTFTVIGFDRDDLTRNELRLHLVVNGVTDR